jgi:cytidine deaminase
LEEKAIAALITAAVSARKNAYAPYSGFCVGAALLCADGKIFVGANVENASYPAGICAERAALSAAVSAGERRFSAIAVCGGAKPLTPCGICRQALYEFGDIDVICTDGDGENRTVTTLGGLLPHAFDKGAL